MNELTLKFTNEPNPVEKYIDQVIEDAQNGFASYTWEVMPKFGTTEQELRFSNVQNHLCATLIRRHEADFTLYSLVVQGEEGEIVYKSTDFDFEQNDTTSLGRMYSAVQEAIAQAE